MTDESRAAARPERVVPDQDSYALKSAGLPEVPAPDLPYRPPSPRGAVARIGLIGAGGISGAHLAAYRAAGWDVAVICDRTLARAQTRAREFFPDARVTDDWRTVIDDPEVGVVDATPLPTDRLPVLRAAIEAGKHVLSQKPFVLDLDEGERLCDLADARGVRLAVNQNGRWSPHMAWMRAAVRQGLLGDVVSCHVSIHWNHGWIAGTPFERLEDLVLYDFGIHWFDFLASVAPGRARSVFATAARARGQAARVPLLAQALVRLEDGQASLVFDGALVHGPRDTTYVGGTQGSLLSEGPDLGTQTVTLTRAEGWSRPSLEGSWFNDGFRGAMGELLCAIEEGREPGHAARANLDSLAIAFAAIESSHSGQEVAVGSVRRIAV